MLIPVTIKKFLITGHPRSGTGYMAELMQLNGIDVQHEKMGDDGISSWMFAIKGADKVPFFYDDSVPKDFEFTTVIQVVREPLAAISSVYHTEYGSEQWRKMHCLICGNKMERAVSSYIAWNKMIAAQRPDYTVRLEDTDQLTTLIKELEPKRLNVFLPEGPTNTREHETFTEEAISDMISPCLADELSEFIDLYNLI